MKRNKRPHSVTPRQPKKPAANIIRLLDEAQRCCRNVAMLSDLLACADAKELSAQTIKRAGLLIFLEAGKLQAFLAQLHKAGTIGSISRKLKLRRTSHEMPV